MEFNELERRLLKSIATLPLNERNLGDVLANNLLEGRAIYFNKNRSRLELVSPIGGMGGFIEELFTFVSLIEYLRKNNYIYVHEIPNHPEGNFLSKTLTLDNIKNYAGDKMELATNVYEVILDYIKSFIHPCSSLKILVSNNFVSTEEFRHQEQMRESEKQLAEAQKQLSEAKKQTKWSIGAVIIASISVVLSTIITFLSS